MNRPIILLLLLCLSSLLAKAQAGNVDSTFGTLGRKTIALPTDFYAHPLNKGPLLYQIDDNTILYAFSQTSVAQGSPLAIIKTNMDGKLDSTFGVNGKAVVQMNSLMDAIPTMLTVADSKIYIGGRVGPDMGIARLNLNGLLDTSFNHTGRISLDFGGTDEWPVGLVPYNSNPHTYYLAGNSDSTTWAMAKLKVNGSLDASFATAGKHTLAVGKGLLVGYAQTAGSPWGQLMGSTKGAGDTAHYRFTVIRINTAQVSTTQTVRARLATGDNICHYVADMPSSNSFYMVGECRDAAGGNTKAAILAVIPDVPSIDNTFGTAGRTVWGIPGQDVVAYAARGRYAGGGFNVLVGGNARQGNTEQAFLLKLDRFGYGDPLFAGKGYVLLPFGQSRERFHEIALMGSRLNERIVAIGPGPNGNLLWSKTKNNTYLRVAPGWFPVQCPEHVNWRQIYDGTNNYTLILGDSGRFYNWNQAEDFVGSMPPIINWHRINTNTGTATLRGFKSSASPGDFWLVGDTGLCRKSGNNALSNTWGRRRLPTRQNLNGVSSTASGLGYIIGDSGLLIYDYPFNFILQKLHTGTRQKLNSITGQSYIVGDSGVILKYASELVWNRQTSPTTQNLFAVSSFPGATVAVGANGTILRTTDGGATWTGIVTPFTQNLYAVDGVSNAQIIVGEGGLILKSVDGGATWRQQISPTTNNLRSVIVESFNAASAVGDNGTVIMTLSGGTFVATQPGLGKAGPEWSLYPNPATRAVTLQINQAKPGAIRAELLDLSGRRRMVVEEDVQAGDWSARLPLEVPPGCYMMRVSTEAGSSVRKLVVE